MDPSLGKAEVENGTNGTNGKPKLDQEGRETGAWGSTVGNISAGAGVIGNC